MGRNKEGKKLGLTTTMQADQEFIDFVNRYLVVKEGKCYRHCQDPVRFVSLFEEGSSLVGAYVCPVGYVSRIVYFANHPDRNWFEKFLGDQVSPILRARDIRVATRHGWELGGSAEAEILGISDTGDVKQYYWTFYPKSDREKTMGAFVCKNCGNLFTKSFSDESTLCSKCSKAA